MFNTSLNNSASIWGIIPDYTAGVVKSTSGFTADVAGLVMYVFNGNRDCHLYVNGNEVFTEYMTYTNGTATGLVYVDEGDVITQSVGANTVSVSIKFYPLKGAI